MAIDNIAYLTVFALDNHSTIVGYSTTKANDLWRRDSIRASERVLFPQYVSGQIWQNKAPLEQVARTVQGAPTDQNGFALAPELTINLSHILFAQTIPESGLEYMWNDRGYFLKANNKR